jgi:thiamine pyridinylase
MLLKTMARAAALAATLFALVLAGNAAQAGQLILKNSSNAPITCTVDGYTAATGWKNDWIITVNPNTPFYVAQNYSRADAPIINWAKCAGLQTRGMAITPKGPNQTLVFNGLQTRVLNVALYPYIPNLPNSDFSPLVDYVVQTYQAQNPQVLLNAIMSENVDIYSFTALPNLLGPSGYDVMELDMLYLGFLASNNLINPQQAPTAQTLPVALNAATYNGQLYGIPSWLCMDFLYSGSRSVWNVTSLSTLKTFLAGQPSGITANVGDYAGSWRLPSIYVNAYVQAYGYANLQNAFVMPPDTTVMNNLIWLVQNCNFNSQNPCIDGTYHNDPNGTSEQVFAAGLANTDTGFSEQSFYINLYNGPSPLYLVPEPWGQTRQPLLFADSFVTNSSTCPPSSQCTSDAAAFTTLMTSVNMKSYIVMSRDLPALTPWRTLLVPYNAFWTQAAIQNNPLYQQYALVFSLAMPFPNTWTSYMQTQMGTQVCAAFQQQLPNYSCKSQIAASVTGVAKSKSAHKNKAKHNTPALAH